ncbi:MAG: RAD55 family ATPase [Desulfofundulus sp.]
MYPAYFGVEGLDQTLEKGLSYGSQIMVLGDTGVGKSVLAGEFIKEGLRCGDTCIYVAFDEPPQVMRRHLLSFKVGTRIYEELNRLVFVDAYEEEESSENYCLYDQRSLDKYFALEKSIIRQFSGQRLRLVVDSLSTLMTSMESNDIVEFHRSRLKWLRRQGVLTMDIFVSGVLAKHLITVTSHLYNVILKMNFSGSPTHPSQMIQVGKLKSQRFVARRYPFTIDPVFGILVFTSMEVGT